MKNLTIHQADPVQGEISVPGDKSISHRSAIFAGLANGTSHIEGFLASDDCLCTARAMEGIGATVTPAEGEDPQRPTKLTITGVGMNLQAPQSEIDCGNSGTAMRLLAGVLAAQPFESTLVGDASLSGRPMGRIITPIQLMGAEAEGVGERQTAPLTIRGNEVHSVHYTLPMASAQVKSCVLLAGMFCEGRTSIHQPAETRDHTERMFVHFGVPVETDGKGLVAIEGPVKLDARDITVPGDISSAAFWLVAAATRPGAKLIVRGVGLNPTRTGILDVLKRMGADIKITVTSGPDDGEPMGDIEVTGKKLQGVVMEGDEIANIIDEIPVLAVAGALSNGVTEIRDAAELRVKETDRISAVVKNLKAMGADVTERDSGMVIRGGALLHGAELECFHDHRIAMAFAVAGMTAKGETVIKDVACIDTSYPGFDSVLGNALAGEPLG
ncbi:3-phosphoshikimate 1-carboxyvinyltransferase [Sulfuriroseicoccus oceanibius]|uniref:3-phosphoshikimate 1-carboxyvinyltransferase n=1 Tax=Sulfuriroseicoccus oceanibius TaxID=2707525 RepID=A0A7T7F410_9BACT|nr:3-phosphoshikimate 1-carboxyvinyltransferase [Sulfuriroseicoccus oceanibius]QQL46234.1 3-phosphoshikimate 1-carboxyvinyltransferase [Sulfuriroseicoccus oceanibius]